MDRSRLGQAPRAATCPERLCQGSQGSKTDGQRGGHQEERRVDSGIRQRRSIKFGLDLVLRSNLFHITT